MDPKTNDPHHTRTPPRVNSSKEIARTKWLALNTLEYTDETGTNRLWDMASRTTKKENAVDAVIIIPMLPNNETILVEQFRPPVSQTTLEFPAGLVDPGETVEQAALRELREETGCIGNHCRVFPQILCMSPGLCNETVQIVLVQVESHIQQELEEGEFCKTHRVHMKDAMQKLSEETHMPLMGLYMFVLGWELGRQSLEK